MVRAVLADNHAGIRGYIIRILADDSRIQVVGEASDFPEAIAKARKLRPDVLILDLHMPHGLGVSKNDLGAQLNSCGTKLLGISFADDGDARALATKMGAVELVGKINLAKQLIPAVVRVASARTDLPPSIRVKPAIRSEL